MVVMGYEARPKSLEMSRIIGSKESKMLVNQLITMQQPLLNLEGRCKKLNCK